MDSHARTLIAEIEDAVETHRRSPGARWLDAIRHADACGDLGDIAILLDADVEMPPRSMAFLADFHARHRRLVAGGERRLHRAGAGRGYKKAKRSGERGVRRLRKLAAKDVRARWDAAVAYATRPGSLEKITALLRAGVAPTRVARKALADLYRLRRAVRRKGRALPIYRTRPDSHWRIAEAAVLVEERIRGGQRRKRAQDEVAKELCRDADKEVAIFTRHIARDHADAVRAREERRLLTDFRRKVVDNAHQSPRQRKSMGGPRALVVEELVALYRKAQPAADKKSIARAQRRATALAADACRNVGEDADVFVECLKKRTDEVRDLVPTVRARRAALRKAGKLPSLAIQKGRISMGLTVRA